MYNFSIPSTFNAYIDNIVRVDRTFEVTSDGGFAGLLPHKKVLFVTSRGAIYGEGSPIKEFDMQESYLRTVFGFMGITEPEFVHADGMDFADATYREKSLAHAREQLSVLAKSW